MAIDDQAPGSQRGSEYTARDRRGWIGLGDRLIPDAAHKRAKTQAPCGRVRVRWLAAITLSDGWARLTKAWPSKRMAARRAAASAWSPASHRHAATVQRDRSARIPWPRPAMILPVATSRLAQRERASRQRRVG